jgi:cytoskeletal protein CcmA (bactofilin family)
MAILATGNTFADGDQVTSTKLNNIANAATFAADAVDDSTTALSGGKIIVKDAGVTPAKLSTNHPNWDSTGLGVGTSSPTSKLDVETSSSSADGLDINNTSTGDPVIEFQLSGTSKFVMGVDNSDSDKFKIGTTAVETSTCLTIDSTGPKLTIGSGAAADTAIIFDGNAQDFYIALDDSADDLLIGLGSTIGTTPAISIDENLKSTFGGDVVIGGTTPTLTIGDAGAEDTAIVFDGNAQDFYVGLDDSADDLVIGVGSTVGTTPAISITDGRAVTLNTSLTLASGATVTAVLDEDNMSTDSATSLATQQSIKAYVDAQVDTADTLAEILAIGNTSGGTDIVLSTTDKTQFRDAAIYINSSTDGQLDIVADTEIQIVATTIDINGAVALNGAITGATDITLSGELDAATLDISGNADIDGTTNLDIVDIDGAVQADATVTVGVDNTGYDVKFFGATSGAYLLWDESADDLKLVGAAGLTVAGDADIDGTTNLDAVDIDGNVQLDGTLTVGVDDTGKDVKLFGATSGAYLMWDESADKLLTAGGAVVDIVKDKLLIGGTAVTTTAAELNVLDAVTAGTVSASLAVVVDSNKDIGSFRNVTLTGELDAGSLDISGDADIDGTANLDIVDIDGAVNMATTALVTGVLTTTATQVATGGITSGSNILSDTDSTDSLGSTGVRWLKGWFDTLTAGTLTIGSGSVTDSSGAISFGNENLTTTGIVTAAGTSVFTNLDISGDVDIDGTTNLDAVDIDGAVQIDSTVTVGVDDTGYDVKFFGATASAYMLWDASTDDLILGGVARLGIGTTAPSAPLEVMLGASEATSDDTLYRTALFGLAQANMGSLEFKSGRDDGAVSGRVSSIQAWSNSETNAVFLGLNPSGGNVGIGTNAPSEVLDVSGNATISGSIAKGSGSFKIPHPLESKAETHNLVHSFIEGPQADLIYRGKVDLIGGDATVNIDIESGMTDGTFVVLCRDVQSFTTNESGWTAVRSSVSGNILTIEAQDPASTDSISWMVVGERQDDHMIDTGWTDEIGKVIVEPLIPEPEEEDDE